MEPNIEQTISDVVSALDAGDFPRALRLARSVYRTANKSDRAHLLLYLGPRTMSDAEESP
ncbi:hypothetical protein [Streptomyces sp. NPDC048248]|uniref:hypothetical protein n=1 Tax=Streptomyces sp. NPDC048248 TaxID=3365523 RepID=UPI00371B71A6